MSKIVELSKRKHRFYSNFFGEIILNAGSHSNTRFFKVLDSKGNSSISEVNEEKDFSCLSYLALKERVQLELLLLPTLDKASMLISKEGANLKSIDYIVPIGSIEDKGNFLVTTYFKPREGIMILTDKYTIRAKKLYETILEESYAYDKLLLPGDAEFQHIKYRFKYARDKSICASDLISYLLNSL